MKTKRLIGVALLVLAAILSAAVLGAVLRRTALAQMVFQAGPVIVVAGSPSSGTIERPLYLLDCNTQTLIVYVYQPQENYLRLMAARRVLADTGLQELANKGITVKQVRDELEKVRRR